MWLLISMLGLTLIQVSKWGPSNQYRSDALWITLKRKVGKFSAASASLVKSGNSLCFRTAKMLFCSSVEPTQNKVYLILSHLILSYLILSHLISSHLTSPHPIPSHPIPSHPISPHPIPSHLISSHLISSHLTYLISSHLISSHKPLNS